MNGLALSRWSPASSPQRQPVQAAVMTSSRAIGPPSRPACSAIRTACSGVAQVRSGTARRDLTRHDLGNPRAATDPVPFSANGWPVEPAADSGGAIWTRPVPGTALEFAVRLGAVAAVLTHVVLRYHYEIDNLVAGEVVGHHQGTSIPAGPESNYFSGTAVAIRPRWFPIAAADGHTARQKLLISDVVSELSGVVRWGGTFDRTWESHFQIDVAPDDPRLDAVAARISQSRDYPDRAAGALAKGS
jgi:hypothetical protein